MKMAGKSSLQPLEVFGAKRKGQHQQQASQILQVCANGEASKTTKLRGSDDSLRVREVLRAMVKLDYLTVIAVERWLLIPLRETKIISMFLWIIATMAKW
jgi:hypothetical protein